MNLRKAEKKDSKTLFDWRNEESARLQSINTEPIPWETHSTWFEKSLVNPNRQIYIAEVDGQGVGMIRADKNENGYELSWITDSHFRGRGYGKQMLTLIVGNLTGRILAQIKKDNTPSLAMAKSLGFRCISLEDALLTEWILEK
jgi:RimJ/RimL family protein N-acetyltransferase